jgi:hypothetical protein
MTSRSIDSIRGGFAIGLALALMLSLLGCGDDSESALPVTGSAPATSPSPSPRVATSPGPSLPYGTHRISGEALLVGQGPAAGAWVNVWIQTAALGISYVYAHGGTYVVADEQGHWDTWADLPDAELTILTTHGGHQPCAAIVDSRSTDPVRLEVIPFEAFDTIEPPRPPGARDPSLTGMVYETTPAGRKPISGAQIWVEHGFEIQTARALTGREGRYYVCNLPPQVDISVTKSGYVGVSVWSVDTSKGVPLDIEMRRNGT